MEGNFKDINYNNNEVVLLREFYKQYKHTAQSYIDFAKNKVYTDNQLKVISKPTHHYAVFGIVLILIGIITFTFFNRSSIPYFWNTIDCNTRWYC